MVQMILRVSAFFVLTTKVYIFP